MSLSDEERGIIVGLEYEKACKTIDKVKEYQTLGHWDTIANRLLLCPVPCCECFTYKRWPYSKHSQGSY